MDVDAETEVVGVGPRGVKLGEEESERLD